MDQPNIFSTPDTNVPPTFAGRNKPPQFVNPLFGPGGDPPTRDALRSIPSITGPQLKRVDEIIFGNRDAITPLQEELNGLRKILDERKRQRMQIFSSDGIPPLAPDLIFRGAKLQDTDPQLRIRQMSTQPDPAIQDRVDDLNRQIGQIRNSLWPQLNALFSQAQLDQLLAMRRGQLVIANNAPTDVPEPLPPPPKQAAQHPAQSVAKAFNAPPLRALAGPAFATTRQVLYRALFRY